ncbi:MAG: S-layer homology domain-containing protein [Clostridia bacterium]|nr:S-layer homology domain-containing protein [Clostridia bacterium]
MKKYLTLILSFLIILNSFSVFAAPGNKPFVQSITIRGIEKVGNTISVNYEFIDSNGVADKSDIRWEYSHDGVSYTEIPGANGSIYTIADAYAGKYIRASVYPKNALNIVGSVAHSLSVGPVLPKIAPDGISNETIFNSENQLDVVADLQSLGVIDNVDEENLRLNDNITRAEFAKVIAKICAFPSVSYSGKFSDVSSDHWAASYISCLADQKIFDGYEDGCFYPENNILMQEAVKVVITVLGYKIEAAQKGYPVGYIAKAGTLKLFSGIETQFYDAPASRKDVFTLIKNALDVNLLTQSAIYTNGDVSYGTVDGNTLRNHLLNSLHIMEGVGTVTATYEAYLLEPVSDISFDEVEIDGQRFKIGNTKTQNHLGEKVYYSAFKDKKTGDYVLSAVATENSINILNIAADEYSGFKDFKIDYITSEAKAKTARISQNAALLYNNRPATEWEQFDIKNGFIKLIDNSGDNAYDVVLIYDYVSMPVESVNKLSGQITFPDRIYYKKMNKLGVNLDNEYKQCVIYDDSGNITDISAISEGGSVSIFESAYGDYMKLIYSDKTVSGVVSEISDEALILDGVSYKAEIKPFLSVEEIKAGVDVTLYLNYEGKVHYVESFMTENYGYIIDTAKSGLADGSVYMLDAGGVETREEDADNDPDTNTKIKVMVAYNKGTKILQMASKCVVDNGEGSSVSITDVNNLPVGQPLKYKLNNEGKLSRITLAKAFDTSDIQRKYYALDNIFSGSFGEAFGIDDNTLSLCIPTNQATDKDYLAETKVEDGRTYDIFAWDFDESSSNAVLVTIHSEMKYNTSDSVGSTTKISVLLNKSHKVNSDGDVTLKLKFLTDGITNEMEVADYGNLSRLDSLKPGDIFYYSQNNRKQIVDCEKVESLSELDIFCGTDKDFYGYAQSMEFGKISVILNRRVFNLSVQTDTSANRLEHFEVPTTNAPPVFVYNKRLKTVSYEDAENIKTLETHGLGADKLFVHLDKNSKVECIAIIKDR